MIAQSVERKAVIREHYLEEERRVWVQIPFILVSKPLGHRFDSGSSELFNNFLYIIK